MLLPRLPDGVPARIGMPTSSGCGAHAMDDGAMHKTSAGAHIHDDGATHTTLRVLSYIAIGIDVPDHVLFNVE